ncbi:MAG TPA: 5-demethoxyubiquinol-8 5-hydroxylase UbiM [Wenzhouxiangella sp.]|nr:5-demethoxyubiquinol-8 5-hydroxylase UbiM [Wenzhouxiangella sp.]
MSTDCDVAIVGAGPAGLCLARALDGLGLKIMLLEAADRDRLANPPEDGREIALTHTSRSLLEKLGVWQRIDRAEISDLLDAEIYDGDSLEPLRISRHDGGSEQLGWLAANYQIRKAAWQAVSEQSDIEMILGRRVEGTSPKDNARILRLEGGDEVSARLVVAADSRFSNMRRAAGIGARMRDYGRSMLVARVEIEADHGHVAREWFAYGRTLALLPLNGQRASAVITLPTAQTRRLAALDAEQFGAEVTALYENRHGRMRLIADRHVYPMVGVWPDRVVAERLALVGDAAVGMHPVTAHGFNLGLNSVRVLADEISRSLERGNEVDAPAVLSGFQRRSRAASLPLFVATSTVVGLYTDERAPARLVRRTVLRAANRLAPFRRAIAGQLTGRGSLPAPVEALRRRVFEPGRAAD